MINEGKRKIEIFHHNFCVSFQTPFSEIGFAFLKSAVMMIGEFEFDTIFYETPLPFPVSTIFLFVIFLVIMAIIIMNLLVGLAVDDIKAVQDQAVLKRLAMQVRLRKENSQCIDDMDMILLYVVKDLDLIEYRLYW